MKSPEYVYTVSSIWRRLIDEERDATKAEMERLAGIFSRSGFTDGYFTRTLSPAMLGRRTEDDKDKTRQSRIRFTDSGRRAEPIFLPRQEKKAQPAVLPKREKPIAGASARFQRAEQIPKTHRFDVVYLPLERFDVSRANGVVLPPVIFPQEEARVRALLEKARAGGAEHALVGNIGHFRLLEGLGFTLHGDFRLNLTNSFSLRSLPELADAIVSPELNTSQIRDLRGKKSVIVYGRVPVMLLEKPLKARVLCDRKGVRFPVLEEGGRSVVVNSVPFYMADKKKLLREKEILHHHFLFTTESPRQVQEILLAYKEGKAPDFPVKRIK